MYSLYLITGTLIIPIITTSCIYVGLLILLSSYSMLFCFKKFLTTKHFGQFKLEYTITGESVKINYLLLGSIHRGIDNQPTATKPTGTCCRLSIRILFLVLYTKAVRKHPNDILIESTLHKVLL